jgi:hypothetical protein
MCTQPACLVVFPAFFFPSIGACSKFNANVTQLTASPPVARCRSSKEVTLLGEAANVDGAATFGLEMQQSARLYS